MATKLGPSILDLFSSGVPANVPREGGLSYGVPIVEGKRFVSTGPFPGEGYYVDAAGGGGTSTKTAASPSPFVIGGTAQTPSDPVPTQSSGGNLFTIGGTKQGSNTTTATPTPSPTLQAGSYAAPKPLTLDPGAYVNNQLTAILAKDSPLIQLARTRAAQASNARGLLNSSIGVQAGEVAAMDAALPIAQQDAQTVGQAGQLNAEQGNLFAREQNNFQREDALKTKDQTFQAQQDTVAFTRQLEAMGYQSKLTTSQLPQQFIAGVSQQAQQGVQAILADPTLKPAAKQQAIQNLVDYSNNTLDWAERFYGIAIPDLPGVAGLTGNAAAPGVVP